MSEQNDSAAVPLHRVKPGQTAAGYIHRESGTILTSATLEELRTAVRLGGYSIVKLVATDRWGIAGGWTDYNMNEVLKLTPYTVVRTLTGDHQMIDVDSVIREIKPWYDRRHLKGWYVPNKKRALFVEIGNEPNIGGNPGDGGPGFGSMPDDHARRWFIGEYTKRLNQTIERVWSTYPEIGIISTSLAPTEHPELHRWIDPWLGAMAPTLAKVGAIALHVYAPADWSSGGPLSFMIPKYDYWFGPNGRVARNHRLIVTEYGLNSTTLDPWTKGHRNAGMAHFGDSQPPLPANVWGVIHFHTVSKDRQHPQTPYDVYFADGDWQYRQRINGGSLRIAEAS